MGHVRDLASMSAGIEGAEFSMLDSAIGDCLFVRRAIAMEPHLGHGCETQALIDLFALHVKKRHTFYGFERCLSQSKKSNSRGSGIIAAFNLGLGSDR